VNAKRGSNQSSTDEETMEEHKPGEQANHLASGNGEVTILCGRSLRFTCVPNDRMNTGN